MRCSSFLLAALLLLAATSDTLAQSSTCPTNSQAISSVTLAAGSSTTIASAVQCGSGFSLTSLYLKASSGVLSGNVTQSASLGGTPLVQTVLFQSQSCWSSSVAVPLTTAAGVANAVGGIVFRCQSSSACNFNFTATFGGCNNPAPGVGDGNVALYNTLSGCANNPTSPAAVSSFYNGACVRLNTRSVKVTCTSGNYMLTAFTDTACSLPTTSGTTFGTLGNGQCTLDNANQNSFLVGCTSSAAGVIPALGVLVALTIAALFGKNTL